MIVTVEQLRAIHYFYFAMGIFGFANAFFVGLGSPLSMLFIAFYIVNSAVGWYMAYVARKRMAKLVVVQSRGFFITHTVLALLVAGLVSLIWASAAIPEIQILNMVLVANYFAAFLAGLWYAATRAEFVKDLFMIYDNYLFRKSKRFIITMKYAYRDFFGRQIVSDDEIRRYKYGTIEEVDDNLMSAWRNRKKIQYVLECLGRIELYIARHSIDLLKEKISFLITSPDSGHRNQVGRVQRELRERERKILEYEKVFFHKTGDSEFL